MLINAPADFYGDPEESMRPYAEPASSLEWTRSARQFSASKSAPRRSTHQISSSAVSGNREQIARNAVGEW